MIRASDFPGYDNDGPTWTHDPDAGPDFYQGDDETPEGAEVRTFTAADFEANYCPMCLADTGGRKCPDCLHLCPVCGERLPDNATEHACDLLVFIL